MARKKNLERAIILGLILSTGVYGSAWAGNITGPITDHSYNNTYKEEVLINNDKETEAAIKIENKVNAVVDIKTDGEYDITLNSEGSGIRTQQSSNGGSIKLTSGEDNLINFSAAGNGIDADSNLTITLDAADNNTITSNNTSSTGGDGVNIGANQTGKILFNAGVSNIIKVSSDGVYTAEGSKAYSEYIAEVGNNEIESGNNGIDHRGSGDIILKAKKGANIITAGTAKEVSNGSNQGDGIRIAGGGNVYLTGAYNNIKGFDEGIYVHESVVEKEIMLTATAADEDGYGNIVIGEDNGIQLDGAGKVNVLAQAGKNYIKGEKVAVHARNAGLVKIQAEDSNIINSEIYGLVSDVRDFGVNKEVAGEINLSANVNNIIKAGVISSNIEEDNFADGLAIVSENGGIINVEAGNENAVFGAVYAGGKAETKVSEVTLSGGKNEDGTLKGSINNVYSAAVIENAGGLAGKDEDPQNGLDVVSALYAEKGAVINVSGINDFRTYYSNPSDPQTSERVVWAYDTADINIDGYTNISTTLYNESPNSKDIAIAAGTATKLTAGEVNMPVADRATVTLTYDNFTTNDGKKAVSEITGDILSAYAGQVDISTDNSNAGINITGNLLAGNNGILNVDLGKGGKLTGRADDYGDAGVVNNGQAGEGNEHQEFFDPAFSSTIHKGGRVDLGMGAGSTWFVTGQSWITTIDTTKAKGDAENERAKVDLVTEYKDKNGSDIAAHALTVYEFKGDADFLMSLSGNRADTDMLYMKHADGNYRIMLDKDITTSDINQDYATGENYSGLRFATVGADSDVTFTVGSYDNGGAFNVEYEVGQDVYGSDETAHENEAYNGSKLDGGKPGDDMVDNFFGNNGEPVSDETGNEGAISTASANSIMLMSEEPETLAEETQANDTNAYYAINHKIIAVKGTELNDTGKTILNMSRANYSNAIYMDRLNKRLGEARYINSEEDEGMWVRIRHDRIGKDAAYRSQNTMYELGYDQKQECDNGERRVGMAIDYMHGDTGYDQIAGKGEIDRYGLWLYDTWMGDKGHYADYVAKWGHLSNDFEVYTMQNGDKVTGDYSNNVFSVSAEYGRKKDIGNDWYFEPQVQAQLARVTGADYTTNQGTKVSVDGINSLIGRAGFRLGKDFGEEKQSTVYIKADVLHEFLGDQDVRVLDKSSDNKWAGISYENEGTWYDVGFGFAAMMSKSSYAFLDLERSFGHDNDETYQINVGMQWSF